MRGLWIWRLLSSSILNTGVPPHFFRCSLSRIRICFSFCVLCTPIPG